MVYQNHPVITVETHLYTKFGKKQNYNNNPENYKCIGDFKKSIVFAMHVHSCLFIKINKLIKIVLMFSTKDIA